MALIAYPVVGKKKSADICAAFIAGAPKGAHGHVFYGVNESNVTEWDCIRLRGEDWYLVDNSYFDKVRGQQFRVTKNRLQVDASKHTSDGKRFKALGIQIKPWCSKPGGHFVLVEQSPSFMSVVVREPHWFDDAKLNLGDERLIIRRWNNDKLKQQNSLTKDLQDAWCLVTHTSAAAVTAVTEGVSAIVDYQHALAGMICGYGDQAHRDERQRFLSVLADNQWTLNEIQQGKAWAWLNR